MSRTMSSQKARVFNWLAHLNDVAHSFVLFFLLFGHFIVGISWHALFIIVVVRLQLAFKGCPMTILSDYLRSFKEDGKRIRIFRHGTTALLYQKFGRLALPLIASGWFMVVLLGRLAMTLLVHASHWLQTTLHP